MRDELIRLIPPAVEHGYEVEYHLHRGTQGSLTITRPPAEVGIFDKTTVQAQLAVHPSTGLLELHLRTLGKDDQWSPWALHYSIGKLIGKALVADADSAQAAWDILVAVIDDYYGG